MAMIDYGALLRIDGEFVNRDSDLFMDAPEWVPEFAQYPLPDLPYYTATIRGNFYVYAGDTDFFLCFYKCYFYVVKDGKIIAAPYAPQAKSQVFYFDDIHVKVSYLDNTKYFDRECFLPDDWERKNYGERYCIRMAKRVHRLSKKEQNKWRSNRWIAEWEYGGHKYEVIYGYGVEPNKNVWDEIKHKSYGFSEKERKIIDEWFDLRVQ